MIGKIVGGVLKLLPFLAAYKFGADRAELKGKRKDVKDAKEANKLNNRIRAASDDDLTNILHINREKE